MRQLAEYGPLAIFLIAFFATGKDIYMATIALMASYSIGMLYLWKQDGKLSKTHQIMWAAIMLFGGLTVFLRNELFIKWKPSIANWAFAGVFLGSHYLSKQPLIKTMMGKVVLLKDKDWLGLSWLWIIFFTFIGFANIYVAYNYDTEFWIKFKVFGLLGLTLLFSILQGVWLVKKGEFIEEDNEQISEISKESVIQENNLNNETNRIDNIKQTLQDRFPNAQINIQDESHLHAGHVGAEDGRGHYRLHIIDDEFTKLSRVKRHQLIYATLDTLMQTDIHALAITAEVADEIF